MMRFIIQRTIGDCNAGMKHTSFRTIDLDVPELELALRSGGYSSECFEQYQLVGVEVLEHQNSNSREVKKV